MKILNYNKKMLSLNAHEFNLKADVIHGNH